MGGQILTNTIVSTFIDFDRRVLLFKKMDYLVGFSMSQCFGIKNTCATVSSFTVCQHLECFNVCFVRSTTTLPEPTGMGQRL